MKGFMTGPQTLAWEDNHPCPNDTDGDGDCWMCSKPETKDIHQKLARARLNVHAPRMAKAVLFVSDVHRTLAKATAHVGEDDSCDCDLCKLADDLRAIDGNPVDGPARPRRRA